MKHLGMSETPCAPARLESLDNLTTDMRLSIPQNLSIRWLSKQVLYVFVMVLENFKTLLSSDAPILQTS